MTGPRVVGIDLSLTSTGLADSLGAVNRIRTKAGDGTVDAELDRFISIVHEPSAVSEFAGRYPRAQLVVIEGLSFGSTGGHQHVRAGLWWYVVNVLRGHPGWRYPLLVVPPATRAMYATGRGNAGKDEVLAGAIRRYPGWDITGNDVADAVVLCAIGARLLGHPIDDPMPQTHLRALAKLTAPTREEPST